VRPPSWSRSPRRCRSVATSLNGKDVIPGNHPLSVGVVGTYSRESANQVVNGADLVCFIGSETGGMTTHFWAVPQIGTPAVQIDIDPRRSAATIRSSPASTATPRSRLRACSAADRASASTRKAWIEEQKICKEWAAKYQPALTSDAVPIRPERICAEFTRHVPDNGIVVVDTGHGGMLDGRLLRPHQSRRAICAAPASSRMAFGHSARNVVPRSASGHVHRDAGLTSHRRD
jgi:acetolactate synthase-1/2/3 large subunit